MKNSKRYGASAVLFSLSFFDISVVRAQSVEASANSNASKGAAFADVEAEVPEVSLPEPKVVPSPADPACPPASPCPSCPPPETKPAEEADSDAVFRAFQVHVGEERGRRFAGGAASILVGGATMGIGAGIADYAGWGVEPWLVAGGVSVGLGVVTLVMPSAAEKIAEQHHADRAGHSAEEARAFEAAWAKSAEEAHGTRIIGSIFSLALGAAGAGIGGAILGGAITMPDNERYLWGSIVTSAGVAFVATGVTGLFIPTPLESSYAGFKAAKPASSSPLSFSVASSASGFSFGLGGRF